MSAVDLSLPSTHSKGWGVGLLPGGGGWQMGLYEKILDADCSTYSGLNCRVWSEVVCSAPNANIFAVIFAFFHYLRAK